MTDRSGPARTRGAKKTVALVAASDRSLACNRDSLIRALVGHGHGVVCIAPTFDDHHRSMLERLGAEVVAVTPEPARFPLLTEPFLRDRRKTRQLAGVLEECRADVVLASGLPAMVEAVDAAHKARIQRKVALLNAPLDSPGPDGQPVPANRIALALQRADCIVAHNAQLAREARALLSAGLIARTRGGSTALDKPIAIVGGAGVDLTHHAVATLPPIDDGLVFLMIASLDLRRGVLDYCHAARETRARGRRARFLFAGPNGTGPGAVPREKLAQFGGAVEDLGPVDDVRPLVARAHVYVHPAHAEAMPRSLLEALAAGRPIITTGTPGCRETVDERVNGCLVPPRDADALNAAIDSFLKRPDLIVSAARASRLKAERRFDVREVNRVLFEAMGLG